MESTTLNNPAMPSKKQVTSPSFCEKMKIGLSNITVEPIMILFLFPSVMTMLTTANLSLDKACRVNLQLNQTICDGLSERNNSMYDPSDEELVQKKVASVIAWKNVIHSVAPACLLLFLGSWSDRHNLRKPCMYLSIFGEAIASAGMILSAYFFYELDIQATALLEVIPKSLSGGWASMYVAVFSYVSSISSLESRTVRVGFLNIISHISYTIGIASSGVLHKLTGYYGVFSLSLVLYFCAFMYGIFFIKEIKTEKDDTPKQSNCRTALDIFNINHVKATLAVAFKPRRKRTRTRIFVIMFLVVLVLGPLTGELNVIYLYTRYRFQWDEIDFSLYYTFNLILHMTGTALSLTIFTRILKIDDAVLGIISSTSKVLASIIFAFAPNTLFFCLAVVVEMLNGTSIIALRSIISKLVPPEELGKINSVFGIFDALIPLIYGPLYTMVYKYTIDSFPGAFFLVGGGLTIPAIGIFIWLYFQHKQDARDARLEAAECHENTHPRSD